MSRDNEAFPPQPSPNGQHADATVDGFNDWLDGLVGGAGGRLRSTPSAPTSDDPRLGATARRLHLMATRVDRRGASEATMERTWEAIMTETLDLDAARIATPGVLPAPGRDPVERERERHGLTPSRPSFAPEPRGPRVWQFVRRWQPAVSTAATLVLLFALIAGYAASRGVLPPGGDGDWRSQLAAVGTSAVQASPSPASVECTVEPLSVEEIQRIEGLPPEFPKRSYSPEGQADSETAAAALAVYQELQACRAASVFHTFALGTDRFVWEVNPSYWRERGSTPAVADIRYDRFSSSIDRVIDEFIFHDGQVRPEIRELAWWSTPQDERMFEAGFQAEDVFVLADGRVAALWGDLTIPHETEENIYGLPNGMYRYAAFAQEDGGWRLDEEARFAFSIGGTDGDAQGGVTSIAVSADAPIYVEVVADGETAFADHLDTAETTVQITGSVFRVYTSSGISAIFTNACGDTFQLGFEEGEATYELTANEDSCPPA